MIFVVFFGADIMYFMRMQINFVIFSIFEYHHHHCPALNSWATLVQRWLSPRIASNNRTSVNSLSKRARNRSSPMLTSKNWTRRTNSANTYGDNSFVYLGLGFHWLSPISTIWYRNFIANQLSRLLNTLSPLPERAFEQSVEIKMKQTKIKADPNCYGSIYKKLIIAQHSKQNSFNFGPFQFDFWLYKSRQRKRASSKEDQQQVYARGNGKSPLCERDENKLMQ